MNNRSKHGDCQGLPQQLSLPLTQKDRTWLVLRHEPTTETPSSVHIFKTREIETQFGFQRAANQCRIGGAKLHGQYLFVHQAYNRWLVYKAVHRTQA
ncbi:hypothetical protein [Baaleninema simplex]|uniref:hypothetical protein n=1 Tax=Baaleninema simplex TaxID=2862350 RepID=UPI00034C1761|nr:hypothetical protein [Baaleninema simplex]